MLCRSGPGAPRFAATCWNAPRNWPQTALIIADARLSSLTFDFGTGVLKVTPAHDKADVEGAFYTFRFDTSRHAPPPVDAVRGTMTSTFDNHGKKYDARAATSFERGDVLGLDYEDGVAICVDQRPRVLCQWIQLDSMGLASLEWDKPRKNLRGTWGYWPSDKGEGDWALTRH